MTDDTSLPVDFERSSRTATNRTVAVAVAVAAPAVAGRHRPHLGDYPVGLDGTATYSGISGLNAAPSPITYHPCASIARRNVLVAYRLIYELPANSPSHFFFFVCLLFSFFSFFFFCKWRVCGRSSYPFFKYRSGNGVNVVQDCYIYGMIPSSHMISVKLMMTTTDTQR